MSDSSNKKSLVLYVGIFLLVFVVSFLLLSAVSYYLI